MEGADAAARLARATARLAGAAQPLYTQLLLPISHEHQGLQFLVDLRADLLQVRVRRGVCRGGQMGGCW